MPAERREQTGVPAWLAVLLALLAVLLVLLTFPVSLPMIALLHALDGRRLRTTATRTRCLRCGHVLGQASLDAADNAWTAEMADMHRRYPGMRMRIVRHCHALCTACGMEYGWNHRTRTLEALAPQRRATGACLSEPPNPAD